jgi:hypothetical protein
MWRWGSGRWRRTTTSEHGADEALGGRPRHVEGEQDAIVDAAEAAPTNYLHPGLLAADVSCCWSCGARVLPLVLGAGRSSAAPAPSLLDEVGERELVLGFSEVVQHLPSIPPAVARYPAPSPMTSHPSAVSFAAVMERTGGAEEFCAFHVSFLDGSGAPC